MTPRRAREILESEESVSVEEIAEALSVLQKKEKKLTNPANSLKAFEQWKRRNKEQYDLREEIRKHWPKSS